VTDVPENLIELECAAELERARLAGLSGEEYDAQWRRWRAAPEAAQAAITAQAEESGGNLRAGAVGEEGGAAHHPGPSGVGVPVRSDGTQ
jgi:hypothetical protein